MLFAANWKMHGNPQHLNSYCEAILPVVERCPHQVVLCPPFPLLAQALMLTSGSALTVGAQNCHWEQAGAFTGEVSPYLLAEMGVRWVIVGHSERRALFGETDETAAARGQAAQKAGLSVIYCVGESLLQREAGQTFTVLQRQLEPLARLFWEGLVVAYEPVWAIGTGRNATPTQLAEAHAFIQTTLSRHFGQSPPVLYGGSVKPENAQEILHTQGVAGTLVGGASLDAAAFSAIINAAP
ncbi:MAG: triose-phosphate isomerase [Thermoanaerobaculaceae bacterium]